MNRRRFRKIRRQRRGLAALEVVLFIGSVFVAAMLFYWMAVDGFVGLFQVISRHLGSPYM